MHVQEKVRERGNSRSWYPLPKEFRACAAANRGSLLLETGKPTDPADESLLFVSAKSELVAWTADELDCLLDQVDDALGSGKYVAGYFTYECGAHFMGLAAHGKRDTGRSEPLAWLGVYDEVVRFDHVMGQIRGSVPSVPCEIAAASPQVEDPPLFVEEGLGLTFAEYAARFDRIQHYLRAGHTYQVNFTDHIRGRFACTPLALYEALLSRQQVPFAAYVHAPCAIALSFSPELFYRTSRGRISARPMKGTWRRGRNREEDLRTAEELLNDEKNRSEHVTIVDLLRNDVGRISLPGSVRVDELFTVEPYSTLLQMTSTISGVLPEDAKPSRIFREMFPSGSITGAPKRRTMEIIGELETQPRGIYTGAIGYFGPGQEACFNVAIRTLELREGTFVLGVGGGITADSRAREEYDECRLKGSFLQAPVRPSLFETMRCHGRILLWSLHRDRLAASAEYLGIHYDSDALDAELSEVRSALPAGDLRVRVVLDKDGRWTTSTSLLEPIAWNGRLRLATERTSSRDPYLQHKTTRRQGYDREFRAARDAGFDEVLFLNEADQVTEGAISNLFLFKDDAWWTPRLECGVLPGVCRRALIQVLGTVREGEMTVEDLRSADAIFFCNALRGIRSVHSLDNGTGGTLWQARGDAEPLALLALREALAQAELRELRG